MKKNIIIAHGCEARDLFIHDDVVNYLDKNTTKKKVGVYEYKKGKRQFIIQLVYKKKDFKDALDIKDAIVIYHGHSRYGQGPVFCTANFKACKDAMSSDTNPWGDHVRMGYDAKNVPCIEEIFDHCVNPKEYPAEPPKKFFASSHVKKVMSIANTKSAKRIANKCLPRGYARRKLMKCHPSVANRKNGLGEQTLKDRHYWYTTRKKKEFHTIVHVGSKDLDSVQLRCGVLFMNSCSSKGHFYAALKRRKKATKSKCVFYMTRNTCFASTTVIFVKMLLKGFNPRKRTPAKKILKKMNGEFNAGGIVMVT